MAMDKIVKGLWRRNRHDKHSYHYYNSSIILISIILTPILIPMLKKIKAGQSIREEGPSPTW